MQPAQKKAQKNSTTDYSLLFARIETELLQNGDEEKWRRILVNPANWRKLPVAHQLKWARLAQMAGEIDTTLEILEAVNQAAPDDLAAWEQRLELLSILDRKPEMARVLAKARNRVDAKTYAGWTKQFSSAQSRNASNSDGVGDDIGPSAEPFEKLRQRQALIARFMQLFSGREDCFARQWVDKAKGKQGYVPERRPLEPADIEDHLKGTKTYGIYLMKSDSTVSTAVIDVDIHSKYREGKLSAEDKRQIYRERNYLISRIREVSSEAGMPTLVEFSGRKGFHFWYFMQPAARAAAVRGLLNDIRQTVAGDLSLFNLEVFPKQDQLSGKGFGNLVKLPLGVHRLSGKRSFFADCKHRTEEAQLQYLLKVPTVDLKSVQTTAEKKTAEITVHPRMQQWCDDHPELYTLEKKCPPLGQIISICRNGGVPSSREEKILFQTIGFLPSAKSQLHALLSMVPEYNPHLVDFKLSRLRGTPLGCKRIHSLLNFTGDMCHFKRSGESYAHPLLHLENWKNEIPARSEKIENLTAALDNLKTAILQVERFMN